MQWVERGNSEYVFGPEHFSDGTLRFIALAVLFLQPPELLPQVIMATQSPRLLDSFDKANVGVEVPEKIGIENIAEKCRHFSEWIKHIEERS